MTIFTRILLACIIPLIIIFFAIIFSINSVAYNQVVSFANEKTRIFAIETAKQINDGFINVQGLIRMVEAHISRIDPNSPDAEEAITYWIESILKATPYIQCIWISFEEGEFFEDRRFSRDFVKMGDSIAVVHDLDDDALDDPEESPWYYYPFTTGVMWFESADYYDYGTGSGSKYTGTVSMPIIRDGRIVGVIGIDKFYQNTFQFIDERQVGNVKLLLLLTQDGEIVYATDEVLMTQSIFDFPFERKEHVLELLAKDTAFNIKTISPFLGVRSSIYFYPISNIDSKSKQLYLYVDLPVRALFQDADNITRVIVTTCVLGLTLLSFILFFTMRGVLRPIKNLTQSANLIASGKLDVNFDSVYNIDESDGGHTQLKNEIYILFTALRNMQASLAKTEEIKAASEAKSNFLAKMSHEIRTPMNAITGMTELALREEMSTVVREHIFTIKQAGANLLSIINDILDLSKIESGKLEIILGDYNLSTLINDVVSIVRMRVVDTTVRFVVNADSKMPNMLYGDEVRVRQVLLNVLSNAVKYTSKGFISFVINGTVDGDTVNLTIDITDTGRGIKEENIDKLFTDFVQVDMAVNRDIEGTGLGLSIAHSLIKAMGGDIEVKSEYRVGSTFTITLPQKIRSLDPLAAVREPETKSALVYERREVYANSMVHTIDNLGVRCAVAGNDEELYEKLRVSDYSFIFVESTLLKSVKKVMSDVNSKAEIVLLTSFGNVVAEKGLSVIAMPVHSISVANVLNGISDSYSHTADDFSTAGFAAPGARVLAVDDIHTNLIVVVGLLSPYGCKVDLAASGAEAIKAVAKHNYDLILMDHMMPEMDGIEATKRIRDQGGDYRTIPIVALTANAVSGAREMFLQSGFDDFLSKPIDPVKMNSVLEKWIPNEKQRPAEKKAVAPKEAVADIFIEGVNVKLGMSRTGGTTAGYMRTLAVFNRDAAEKIGQIKKCLDEDNLKLYIIHVHALKSAAANIGAEELSDAAKALEMAGKKEDIAFIKSHTPGLLSGLESLLVGIDEVVSAEKERRQEGKSEIDMKAFKAVLGNLDAALNTIDPGAISAAVEELRQFENTAEAGEAIENILKNILNGEYDEAVAVIKKLSQGG
ncbi:MAG: response regulator [Chitinispirillales bacterium]|jgi:signal transduction histidine kinase/CheY-like chemotaxis protein/HPt (histidine-containing phosphotransfer) domain-containing protein|nr:response regulator [Chitinispirillales bacterium]